MRYHVSAWSGGLPITMVAMSRIANWMRKLKIAEPTLASGKISRGR